MVDFSKIYLAWRKGKGSRRHIVGLLERSEEIVPKHETMRTEDQIAKLMNEITTWKGKYYTLLEKYNNFLEDYKNNG